MDGFSKTKAPLLGCFCFGGATRNRTGDKGFADLCLTAWLWRLISHTTKMDALYIKKMNAGFILFFNGAVYGARTRYLNLGKVALYQMS